jgi:hypothetical protein
VHEPAAAQARIPPSSGFRAGRASRELIPAGRPREALGEYAVAEDIREILRQEQEHQIDLATALGESVPDVSHAKGK